tara:strand:+ start:4700 stop:5215 length:516 start_codon:yes stop_codon:yes gene_type:complete
MKKIRFTLILSFLTLVLLNSCGAFKYKKVDANDYPPEPEKRIAKNMEEGRGIKLFGNQSRGGEFEFANSNPLWRASLDVIDFMPLLSVDYGGGVIITDWYSEDSEGKESIKLTIKFLSNEIRSDAVDIKVFKRVCSTIDNCQTSSTESELNSELKLAILKKAATYKKNKVK